MTKNLQPNWLTIIAAGLLALGFAFVLGSDFLGGLNLAIGLAGVVALVAGLAILRQPFWGAWLILFALPLERLPSLDVAGLTLKANHFLISVTLLAWILAGLVKRQWKFQADPVLAFILLFWFWNLYSALQAQDQTRGLLIFGFLTLTIVGYILMVQLISNPQKLRHALQGLLLSALLVGIFGLWQFAAETAGLPAAVSGIRPGYDVSVFGFPRIHATAAEPLYYANYLLIPIGLLVAMLIQGAQTFSRRFLWGLLLVLGLNFLLTLSRGGYLALAVMFLALVILQAKKIFVPKNAVTIILTVVIVLFLGGWILAKISPEALDIFTGHAKIADLTFGESTQGRLLEWRRSLQAYYLAPFSGLGPGNYGPWVAGFPSSKPEFGWVIVNNQYLETLAETGALGLGFFILLWLISLWRAGVAYRRAASPLVKSALLGFSLAAVGTLVQYNFFSTIYIIHIWVLLGLLTASGNLAKEN